MFDITSWLQSSAMPTVVGGLLIVAVGYGSLHAQVDDLRLYQEQQFSQLQTQLNLIQSEIHK